MTRCTTLDQAVLEKTKIDKVLQRLIKKGDDESKVSAQKVLDNAAVVTKQKVVDRKPLQDARESVAKDNTVVKPYSDKSRVVDTDVGTKRPKAIDASTGKAFKIPSNTSITSPRSSSASSSKFSIPSAKRQQPIKPDSKSTVKPNPSATPNPKVKSNHISAKPSGFFSSLQSASKKPGTSNAALLSAKAKEGKDRYANA